MRFGRTVRKYLGLRAEPEARETPAVSRAFGHSVVIPAYGEGESLFRALESIPEGPGGEVLTIVVVNARAASPAWVHEENRRTLLDLARVSRGWRRGRLLVIDRACPGRFLPEGQGVGLARKVGTDVALALAGSGLARSPWIHSTDADAILPSDYFERAAAREDDDSCSALIYPFEHEAKRQPELAEASRLYEISLRHYVLGLAFAGSPYAFHTVGSTLCVRGASYAAVGGYPRRNAAEDFYLLNKLAKCGGVARLPGFPILLEARTSDRVPFGTGRALARIGADSFALDHPEGFRLLARWLEVLEAFAGARGRLDPRASVRDIAPLAEALKRMGAFSALAEAARRARSPESLRRRLHIWFDAFRTLKLLHILRDYGFPPLPVREALVESPFVHPPSGACDFDSRRWLAHLVGMEKRLAELGEAA